MIWDHQEDDFPAKWIQAGEATRDKMLFKEQERLTALNKHEQIWHGRALASVEGCDGDEKRATQTLVMDA